MCAVQANGAVPPGNARNSPQQWVRKTPRAKPELKLTPGKGLEDLTCSLEELLDTVVKTNKVFQHCSSGHNQICRLQVQHLGTAQFGAAQLEAAVQTSNICNVLCLSYKERLSIAGGAGCKPQPRSSLTHHLTASNLISKRHCMSKQIQLQTNCFAPVCR